MAVPRRQDLVPLAEATKTWFRVSLQTFGGPAGQIAVMHRFLVDEQKWLGEGRFLHALNYCMLLPGPEAQQLAIYTGWLLNGTLGGLIAGVLFVVPGVLAMLALSAGYVEFGETSFVVALFAGVSPAVLAIVIQAVIRVGRRALHNAALVAFAVAAFAALAVFGVPFPVVVLAAGIAGWLMSRIDPRSLGRAPAKDSSDTGERALVDDEAFHAAQPSLRRALVILGIGLPMWLVPTVAAAALAGTHSVYARQGLFFSGTAVVTFGGAYAVLSFVAERAVNSYHWLLPGEMARGLALAESTPGPLIMVVQFVAFLGAYRDPGALPPWAAGLVASLLTTWVTFVPCFVFVFLGAPYVEQMRRNASLSAALTGITAAVVGVIANLGVFFGVHTLFEDSAERTWGPVQLLVPEAASLRWEAVGITAIALLLMLRVGWGPLRTLGVCALLGLGLAVIP